jgi:hypothetical protein
VADIEDFRRLVAGDHGLVVVSAVRDNGTISSSVVNAGVLTIFGVSPAKTEIL